MPSSSSLMAVDGWRNKLASLPERGLKLRQVPMSFSSIIIYCVAVRFSYDDDNDYCCTSVTRIRARFSTEPHFSNSFPGRAPSE